MIDFILCGVITVAVLVIIIWFLKRRPRVPKDVGFPEVRRRRRGRLTFRG
jgi:uncharacterized protein HemY